MKKVLHSNFQLYKFVSSKLIFIDYEKIVNGSICFVNACCV